MTNASHSGIAAEAIADLLAGYGVTHVFMVPAILRRTFAELERRHPSICTVSTHGEKSAAYMADGYARAAGRPAICAAQAVGAMNLAAGLREPFLARSPVIALTGGRLARTKFRGVYQEADDFPAFESVTKFNASIDDASRFPDLLRQAFRIATSGSPGPVHLQVQGNEGQLDLEEGPFDVRPDARFAAVPPFRPRADDVDLRRLLELLSTAQRPVIVAGGGVRASQAGGELVKLAELLDVPVATSGNGRDVIPGTHRLSVGVVGTYSRESANRIVGRADLVCFVGSQTGGMTTHGWTLPPIGTSAVQIDIDPAALGRNYPLAVAVLADARAALARMVELVRAGAPAGAARPGWHAEVELIREQWRQKYRDVLMADDVPLRPERLCAELTELVPDDAMIVVDTGHSGMWMSQFFDLRSLGQSYARSCGHLGWALPAAMGAKCALPDRPVIAFTGDGGFYYHLAEIETAVRRGIHTITVVNNNRSGNQSKRGFDRAYGGQPTARSRELWSYTDVDLAAVAQTMGALGLRVTKADELGGALEVALTADRPVVIDVRTDIDVVAPLPVS